VLAEQRSRLERKLEGLDKDIESRRRMLELVEATEQQLVAEQLQAGPHASGADLSSSSAEPGTEVRGGGSAGLTMSALRMGVSVAQPMPAGARKRTYPSSPVVEPPPLTMRALPVAVWEDHLLPLLTCKEAARLGCTSKALRVVVRYHFIDLLTTMRNTWRTQLRAALTTFPSARKLTLGAYESEMSDEENEALLQWLREGGQGRHLAVVKTGRGRACDFVHRALQQGSLPSLKVVDVDLAIDSARASLTRGALRAIQELHVSFDGTSEEHLAALGLVRELPALTTLRFDCLRAPLGHVQWEQPWPDFIPSTLKALHIYVYKGGDPLLCALTRMLRASGAKLERLRVSYSYASHPVCAGLVHLAQALRYYSPTLKSFRLSWGEKPRSDQAWIVTTDQVEQLRVEWADVLAGLSACRELQVLVLPHTIRGLFFPGGTAFVRLTPASWTCGS
jgi:hypothetical protein